MEGFKSTTASHNSLAGVVDEDTMSVIQNEQQELQDEFRLLERVAKNPNVSVYEVDKAKIPKPKAFGGARNSKEIDKILFEKELYLNATKCNSDQDRLKITPMYLANNAKLCWHTKVEENIGIVLNSQLRHF